MTSKETRNNPEIEKQMQNSFKCFPNVILPTMLVKVALIMYREELYSKDICEHYIPLYN